MSARYPFSAIAGQEELKQALLLTAVDPLIGGLLAFGDRGTGKSTAVRALAALLPEIRATSCAYHCDPDTPAAQCDACRKAASHKLRKIPIPVVDLPLGATEDRVLGALNLERALSHGEKHFEPGLLAQANRGYLYVDEVNLLEDHIVDLLLDVAASGENVVEREGLSLRHPARLVLVGSGNPEEGELRPQLLDRFGLSVEVRTPSDVSDWVEIVKRRDAFERDPEGFRAQWEKAEDQTRRRILKARRALAAVVVPDAILERAAALCIHLRTDGLRGQLTLMRAARALAAFNSARQVTLDHLRAMAAPALRHRLRRNPLDETGSTVRIDRGVAEVLGA
ncbi:magnesium chelatase ATPase subunit I [Aestuariivirga sp.]|jgi:magnesium chelatase subunit I|uniref:magnesium chelatase ATPase subunit I n=1 Tax=Aestuariivirga sp. TaxID=2650926 RepID=UPI003784EF46